MHNTIMGAADLKELVDYLKLEYMPEKVILFGSYGTDKHGYNSDIDLLIVKETEKRFVDRVVELVRLIRKRFGAKYPVEPLIYTPDEFKRAKDINSSFIKNILSNGIVLYGKKYSSS